MRKTYLVVLVTILLAAACSGNPFTEPTTCDPGYTLVNGKCVKDEPTPDPETFVPHLTDSSYPEPAEVPKMADHKVELRLAGRGTTSFNEVLSMQPQAALKAGESTLYVSGPSRSMPAPGTYAVILFNQALNADGSVYYGTEDDPGNTRVPPKDMIGLKLNFQARDGSIYTVKINKDMVAFGNTPTVTLDAQGVPWGS